MSLFANEKAAMPTHLHTKQTLLHATLSPGFAMSLNFYSIFQKEWQKYFEPDKAWMLF